MDIYRETNKENPSEETKKNIEILENILKLK